MSELIPCPFCGGPAELRITDHIPNGYDYTPRCMNPSCCGRITKKYSTRELAIYSWNRRIDYRVKQPVVDKKIDISTQKTGVLGDFSKKKVDVAMSKSKDNRFEKMVEMRESGASYSDIAKEMGISRQRVHQIMSKYGGVSKGRAIERDEVINPNYPPDHCFTVMVCDKCGEHFEPICRLPHICKKQNSYPIIEE